MLLNTGVFDFESYDKVGYMEGRLACTPFMVCMRWYNHEGKKLDAFVIDRKNPTHVIEYCLGIMSLNRDVTWYAHNMGNYDGLILLDTIINLGWKLRGTTNGSQVIEFRITPRAKEKPIVLRDTINLVAGSLSHKDKHGQKCDAENCAGCIPCDFELPSKKLFKDEYTCDMRKQPDDKLLEGCFADCQLTLELLDTVDNLISSWGGERKLTLASSALSCIKASLKARDETIPNHDDYENGRAQNQTSKLAYFGGRVEVFRHAPEYLCREYDINSSYPHAMTMPMPWEPCGEIDKLPSKHEGIVNATVTVPETMYFPPLPYRSPYGGVFFPTGTWRGWFALPELQYAETLGVTIHVHKTLMYTRRNPFTEFINTAYEIKSTSHGAKRHFAKILMNSAYGKFGMRQQRESIYIFESQESAIAEMLRTKKGEYVNAGKFRPLNDSGRVFAKQEYAFSPTTHYAIAAYITAYARIALHRLLVESHAAYCDTDAIHSGFTFRTSTALGGLKLEMSGYKAEFYAPKIYRLTPDEGGKPTIASKGFKCDAQVFESMVRGEDVGIYRTKRLRTLLRQGSEFEAAWQVKCWHGLSMKRRPLYGSQHEDTRPWTVDEINSGVYRKAKSPFAISYIPE